MRGEEARGDLRDREPREEAGGDWPEEVGAGRDGDMRVCAEERDMFTVRETAPAPPSLPFPSSGLEGCKSQDGGAGRLAAAMISGESNGLFQGTALLSPCGPTPPLSPYLTFSCAMAS